MITATLKAFVLINIDSWYLKSKHKTSLSNLLEMGEMSTVHLRTLKIRFIQLWFNFFLWSDTPTIYTTRFPLFCYPQGNLHIKFSLSCWDFFPLFLTLSWYVKCQTRVSLWCRAAHMELSWLLWRCYWKLIVTI